METKNDVSPSAEETMHPSESPAGGSGVGALVTKSKKAASSLFTLLHAKVSPRVQEIVPT
jgi:hypothetical protein